MADLMYDLNVKLVEESIGLPPTLKVTALRNISSKVDGCFVYEGTKGLLVYEGNHPVVLWDVIALGSNPSFIRHRSLLRAEDVSLDAIGVAFDDPQTAFGLAVRLDDWEEAGATEYPQENWCRWSNMVSDMYDSAEHLNVVKARIEQVGLDHAIRRKLDWEVEPGTLATLKQFVGWELWSDPKRTKVQGFYASKYGAWWANNNDPGKALKAIYEEVCGG